MKTTVRVVLVVVGVMAVLVFASACANLPSMEWPWSWPVTGTDQPTNGVEQVDTPVVPPPDVSGPPEAETGTAVITPHPETPTEGPPGA